MKEIEDKVVFDEIKEELDEEQEIDYKEIEEQENERIYSNQYDLAAKIFNL